MGIFEGQSVLITGASGGLGEQMSRDFARKGAKVALNYSSSKERADRTAAGILEAGGEAVTIRADIARSEEVHSMVEQVVERFGSIDILVNNAGLSIDAPFLDMREQDWDRVIDVNLKGPFLVSQAVGRHMVAARRGHADVAVANVMGSCIYNILFILGIAAMVTPMRIPADISGTDIWVMLAASLALLPMLFGDFRVCRKDAAILLCGYAVYIAYLANRVFA